MRPQAFTHQNSRSPSPILPSRDQNPYNNSPFQTPTSFLQSPSKPLIMIPKEILNRILTLETENKQQKNEIALLSGMNQTKDHYIKELEDKITSLYSQNYSSPFKKPEETINILLKEQKRLFDSKEKALLKEIELLKEKPDILKEKSAFYNEKSFLDRSDNSKEATREISRNLSIEKTYLESSLKAYKGNILQLEAKIENLNKENDKLSHLLKEKSNDSIQMSYGLEFKLKEEFQLQKEEIEGNLAKILEENKKIVTFNNSLLSELDHYKGINDLMMKKHENHIEELKISLNNQNNKKIEDLKSKSLSEQRNLEAQIAHIKAFSCDLEGKYEGVMDENNRLNRVILEKDNKISDSTEKISYLQRKIEEIEHLEGVLVEKNEKIHVLEDKIKALTYENSKIGVLESEKQGFLEKIDLLTEESRKFEGIIYERMEEIISLTDKNRGLDILNKEIQEKDLKIGHFEEDLLKILSENTKLNQIMKASINERELLLMKYEAFKQESSNKLEELKLLHSKDLSFLVAKEVDHYKEKSIEITQKNELLTKEIAHSKALYDNMSLTLNNYTKVLIEKEGEIEVLQREIDVLEGRVLKERAKDSIEKEQLIQKLHKIEENHLVQLKELRSNYKAAELNNKEKEEYNKEIALLKSSLSQAQNQLTECYRLFQWRNKGGDSISPYKNLDLGGLIQLERDHNKCFEDIKAELRSIYQRYEHLQREFGDYKEEHEGYKEKCIIKITSLENELKQSTYEKEGILEQLMGLKEEMKGLIIGCEAENRVRIEAFQLNNSYIELKRVVFDLENEIRHLQRELVRFQGENTHLKRNLDIFMVEKQKKIAIIEENRRNNKENSNLNRSFDNNRRDLKMNNVLNDNERLNREILKRCRDILN